MLANNSWADSRHNMSTSTWIWKTGHPITPLHFQCVEITATMRRHLTTWPLCNTLSCTGIGLETLTVLFVIIDVKVSLRIASFMGRYSSMTWSKGSMRSSRLGILGQGGFSGICRIKDLLLSKKKWVAV